MSIVQNNTAWANTVAAHVRRPVVVSPGSRNTPLVLAFAAAQDAELHCILDERAAGFFALGLARATGRAVILVCTSGSAGAHYLPAVIEASASRIPLLILTADRPPEHHHCGAPQTINQQGLFGVHARWFVDLGAPNTDASLRWLRTVLTQALDQAEGASPGPVHINLPMREPLWAPGSDAPPACSFAAAHVWRGPAQLSDEGLDALARRLAALPRGVIVAGVRAPSEADALLALALGELASRLGWPVLAEPTSQLRKPTLGRHLVSTYDALLRDANFAEAHAPDIVLRLGQFPTSKVLGQWLGRFGVDRTLLVEPHGAWLDPTHAANALVVAEPLRLIRGLLAHLPQSADNSWAMAWQAAEQTARARLDALCADGIWEAAIAREVLCSLPAGGALHVASSMPIRDLDSFAPPSEVAIFANRGANGIDGTLACALGGAKGWPGPTAVLLGDLAFLHDVGALQLARQLAISLTVVVVNNGGGGIFEFLPIAQHPQHFERFFYTPQTADIEQLVQAVRANYVRAQTMEQLRAGLEAARCQPGLSVVEAVVERGDNVRRHRAAWAAVHAAIG